MKEETINICPSWRGIANTCIMLLEVGNEEAQATAKAEIRRMGDILDGEFKQGAFNEEKDS
jgi:hypothetical protein|tara:strand:+ start:904 stop:1086 length:183 start_codon:yes stop_codon:yes gene_type:complete